MKTEQMGLFDVMLRCVNAKNWKPLNLTEGKLYRAVDGLSGDEYVTVENDDGDLASYHAARFEEVKP